MLIVSMKDARVNACFYNMERRFFLSTCVLSTDDCSYYFDVMNL